MFAQVLIPIWLHSALIFFSELLTHSHVDYVLVQEGQLDADKTTETEREINIDVRK